MNWLNKVSSHFIQAINYRLALKQFLQETLQQAQNPTRKKQIESIALSAIKSEDHFKMWKALENLQQLGLVVIPQYLASAKSMFDWHRDISNSTRTNSATKATEYLPAALQFSAQGFPDIDPKFNIFIPKLSLNTYKSHDPTTFQSFMENIKEFAFCNDKGTYVIGSPQAWKRFLELAYYWYPQTFVNLDALPVNDVTAAQAKRKLSPDSYSSMSTLLSKYALGQSVKLNPLKQNKIIENAQIKKINNVDGIYITFPLTDDILFRYTTQMGLQEYLEKNFQKYEIFARNNSVFIPLLPATNFAKMIELRNWLITEFSYGTAKLNEALKTANPKLYDKIQGEKRKSVLTKGTEDTEHLQEQIAQRTHQNEINASKDFISVLLPDKKYTNIIDNPEFFQDAKNKLVQMYPYAFDISKNPFLQSLPPQIAEKLVDAQAEGVAYGSTRNSFVLADQPGSGKTNMGALIAETHAKIADQKTQQKAKILIISPSQLLHQNWIKDSAINKFIDPNLNLQEEMQVFTADDYDQEIRPNTRWVITHYHMFKDAGAKNSPARKLRKQKIQNFIHKIKNTNFCCVVLDESQILKNPDSSITANVEDAISKIQKRIAMSGTPSDNTPGDLYGQLSVINHSILYRHGRDVGMGYMKQDKESFCMEFFGGYGTKGYTIEDFKNNVVNNPSTAMNLLNVIESTFLRREREDINQNLPPSKESENNNIINPDGTTIVTNRQFWTDQYNQAVEILADSKAGKEAKLQKTQVTEELLQKHKSQLIQSLQNGDPQALNNLEQSLLQRTAMIKAFTTAQMAVQHIKSQNSVGKPNKALILTNFIAVAKSISDYVNQLSPNTANFITGDVEGDQRGEIAELFKNPDSPLKVLVFTIETGSVGYNFDVANLCLFNDFSWNPSKNEQGTDRIRRLTSKLNSEVIFNVMPDEGAGESNIDKRMYTIMQAKRKINNDIHNAIKTCRLIKENPNINPQQRAETLQNLAKAITTSMYQSLKEDQNARLMYQPLAAQIFTSKAANSWYHKLILN